MLGDLEEVKRTVEGHHTEEVGKRKAINVQRLEEIKEAGKATSMQQEKEMQEVEEDFRRRKEKVLEYSKEVQRKLDDKAEMNHQRHQENMKWYTSDQVGH